MSCFSRSFLAISISVALFAPQIHAEDALDDNVQELPAIDQCLLNEPEPENPNEQPINVEADNLEAINGDKATYSGSVVVVQGKKRIEADTVVSTGSWKAATRAAGAAIDATQQVIDGRSPTAFCAIRPPGHHAIPSGPMDVFTTMGWASAKRLRPEVE